jgi:hypothetical protein
MFAMPGKQFLRERGDVIDMMEKRLRLPHAALSAPDGKLSSDIRYDAAVGAHERRRAGVIARIYAKYDIFGLIGAAIPRMPPA